MESAAQVALRADPARSSMIDMPLQLGQRETDWMAARLHMAPRGTVHSGKIVCTRSYWSLLVVASFNMRLSTIDSRDMSR